MDDYIDLGSGEVPKLKVGEGEDEYACYDCGLLVKRTETSFWRSKNDPDEVPYKAFCNDCYKWSGILRQLKEKDNENLQGKQDLSEYGI